MAEPKIVRVTIQTSGGVTVFNPKTQTINLNDSVFWVNQTNMAHQPAPDNGKDDQWVAQPIPPQGESPQVAFDDVPGLLGQTIVNIPYHCAKHPTLANEKGVITVNLPPTTTPAEES